MDSKEITRQAEVDRFEEGARMLALESLVIRIAAVLETTHVGALQFGIGIEPSAPEEAKALNAAVNRHLVQIIGRARAEAARNMPTQETVRTTQ